MATFNLALYAYLVIKIVQLAKQLPLHVHHANLGHLVFFTSTMRTNVLRHASQAIIKMILLLLARPVSQAVLSVMDLVLPLVPYAVISQMWTQAQPQYIIFIHF